MADTPADYQQCSALRVNNERCRGRAIADGLCWAHQPGANANRAKGGRNRSTAARSVKALPERLRPVADLLTSAMARTFKGDMDPRVATALGALASAYVRVVSAGELEVRLRDLEQLAHDAEAGA